MANDIILRTDDHPEANGRQPRNGEVEYRLNFKLETGENLIIQMGQSSRDDILTLLEQEQTDIDKENTNKWPVTIWKDCYSKTPKSLLSQQSFTHPARMSYKLCTKIFEYGEQQKYWKPGDTIIDIFGGVGMTAVIGCPKGYNVILVELEQFFHDLAGGCECTGISSKDWYEYLDKWKEAAYLDGRHWCPFCINYAYRMKADETMSTKNGCKSIFGFAPIAPHHFHGNAEFSMSEPTQDYGTAFPLQGDSRYLQNVLKQLPEEPRLSGGIFSPPFGQTLSSDDPDKRGGLFKDPKRHKDITLTGVYGSQPGQIGVMPYGAVFSPQLYLKSDSDTDERQWCANCGKFVSGYGHWSGGGFSCRTNRKRVQELDDAYRKSPDPDKYWGACFLAYRELFETLPPGGVVAVVLRSFVKKGVIVDLPNYTAELLEVIGFDIIEEVRALLEETIVEGIDLFTNEEITRKKSSKSFFRMIQESKGSPPIDFEVILFAQKPRGTDEDCV